MPELPEVETTMRGVQPFVLNKKVRRVVVRDSRLRWPVPKDLNESMAERKITSLHRRSKYLLFGNRAGHLLVHLGMSGSLRIVSPDEPPSAHDHIDIEMASGKVIRYRDPRRFGSFLWTDEPPEQHKLLRDLGPEPLSDSFTGAHLYARSRGRKVAVKNFIMDAHVVVGVGNIYASESLHISGIHPDRHAGRVSAVRYEILVESIRDTLKRSIELGGTTLRDFVNSDGNPGYFKQTLMVYGRESKSCRACGTAIKRKVIGQRSSFFCPNCQR
ncbi:MAG: formamidopyrimidine-DNA glycosylase [Parasphingorhabdus sp.]|jgi:formamidopyrimidine-DNA glycosylase